MGGLTRSIDDKVVSGLCGGLGRHFGVDPLVFRIAFVVMSLAGGTGVLLYLVGWALVPDDQGRAFGAGWLPGKDRGHKLVAAALAGCGALFLIDRITDGHGDDIPLGLVLIGVGAAVLWSRRSGQAPTVAPPPMPPPMPAAPAAVAVEGVEPDDTPPTAAPPPPPPTPPPPTAPPPPPPPPPAALRPPEPPKAAAPRSALAAVTFSLLAILAGVAALAEVDAVVGLALALLLVAGAMVVGAWRGRARGLIPLAVVLSGALFVASLLDVPFKGGAGDRLFVPISAAEIRSPYRLAAGEQRIDLRRVDLAGRTVPVVASTAMGTLIVTVPVDATVEVHGHVGAGKLIVFNREWDGVSIDQLVVVAGREGGGRLVLHAQVGFGELEVRRAAA